MTGARIPSANRQAAIAASAALRIALEDSGANVTVIPAEPGVPDLVSSQPTPRSCSTARFFWRASVTPSARARNPTSSARSSGSGSQGVATRVEQIDVVHEGAGDCIWDASRQLFWVGSGPRSSAAAGGRIAAYFGRQVVELPLATEQFYHLDTCFCPLSGGEILYYPPAL